jgi:hypothetical protein
MNAFWTESTKINFFLKNNWLVSGKRATLIVLWLAIPKMLFFVKDEECISSVPIIRSFLLYIRHWYVSCSFDDRFQAESGWNRLEKLPETCRVL